MNAMKVVVKNTFLECVEEGEEEEGAQPRLLKSQTVPLSFEYAAPVDNGNFTPHGIALATAAAAAAAAAAAKSAARRAEEAAAAAVPQYITGGVRSDSEEQSLGVPKLQSLGQDATWTTAESSPVTSMQASGSFNGPRIAAKGCPEESRTTVMIRNVPNDYTRAMLLELLDLSGFAGRYNFLYVPTDFSRGAGLGYAFVNLATAADAREFRSCLEGFRQWSVPSSKVCTVGWSNPCQGLQANIERYKNSPIMHDSVPDEFKPMLFVHGVRVQFPPPTKKLRKPDMFKHGRYRGHA